MLSELLQRLLGRYGGGFQDDAYLLRRITQAIAEFLLEQGNVMCPGGGTLCAKAGSATMLYRSLPTEPSLPFLQHCQVYDRHSTVVFGYDPVGQVSPPYPCTPLDV